MLEPVAYGLKFAGQFSGATLFPSDFTSQLQATGVDASGYAAKLRNGHVAVIILNKDADRDVEVSLDFGKGRTGRVEITTLHAPALDSREASITLPPKPEYVEDGRYTVTVPYATGLSLIVD